MLSPRHNAQRKPRCGRTWPSVFALTALAVSACIRNEPATDPLDTPFLPAVLGTTAAQDSSGDTVGSDTPSPRIVAGAASLEFDADSSERAFSLHVEGVDAIEYFVRPGADWLTVDAPAGMLYRGETLIRARVDRATLPLGSHPATMVVEAPGAAPIVIAVIAHVGAGQPPSATPQLYVSVSSIDFGTTISTRNFLVQNAGAGVLEFTVSTEVEWITLDRSEGSSSGEHVFVTVGADRAGHEPGLYFGKLMIASTDGAAEIDVQMGVPDVDGDVPPPPATVRLSGHVRQAGAGVEHVVVSASGNGPRALTDGEGAYELTVPGGWSGALTAQHDDLNFSPSLISISGATADAGNHDFDAVVRLPVAPKFGVKAQNRAERTYHEPRPVDLDDVVFFEDGTLRAELRWLGRHRWELRLFAKEPLIKVTFPLETEREHIGGDGSDDVLLVPRNAGQAFKADRVSDDDWQGSLYPGEASAPLVILADASGARMVAATNWPPMTFAPVYRPGRIALRYRADDIGTIMPGETRVFGAIYARRTSYPEFGIAGWRLALAEYRDWLDQAMLDGGLAPIPYPQWMRQAHGWFRMHLHDTPDVSAEALREQWQRYRPILPWMQIWGQMCPRQDSTCTDARMEIDDRYLPQLLEIINEVRQQGHIGLYSRPEFIDVPMMDGSPEGDANLQFLLEWITQNMQEFGCNAAYLDTVGSNYHGDALTVAQHFIDTLPHDVVIGGRVDVYPVGFLFSGALFGHDQVAGGPQYTDCLDCFDDAEPAVTFPRFGRYLLHDRVVFLGSSDKDWYGWGAENDYWTERQVFLLGAKFDAWPVSEPGQPDVINRAIELTIAERDRVGWWQRWPAYRDRDGIASIPAGVDVRRFVDNQGVDLLVVDNWNKLVALTFTFEGQPIPVPQQRLSIIEP